MSDAGGRELPYKGRQVRFGPPEASTFLLIGPLQTLSKSVDLASDYDIHKGGAYKVTYVKTLRLLRGSGVKKIKDIGPEKAIPLQAVHSNTLSIWINDALMTGASAYRSLSISSCTVGRIDRIYLLP